MSIKMIVTDLDGTFYHQDLTYDKKRFNRLYDLMKKSDIKFVVASGNQYYQLISFFDKSEEMTFVAENGGYIVNEGKEMFSINMKRETYESIINLLIKIDTIKFILVCGKKSSYVLSTIPEEVCKFFQKYFPKMQKVKNFTEINDQIIKISLVSQEEEVEQVVKQINKVIDENLTVVTSGQGCIDVIVKGINKGNAIKKLMHKWDIKPEEIMAFGDEMNDLEMLEIAKYGFVMANGSPVLKERIGLILPLTNEQDGELEVIEEYLKNPEQFELKYNYVK